MLEKLSFTKRYVLALGIIAVLSTLAYFNLVHLISSQANNGKMINISGGQKILAQQIAFHAIYYKIQNLENNIARMEDSHNQLISSAMSESLRKAYFKKPMFLDKKVKDYLFHAKAFNTNRNGKSLTYLLKNSNSLLLDLDKAVSLYLEEANANTKKLKEVELYIFILTLLTLIFEAIFIFKPANTKINEKTKELTSQKDYSNAVIESSTSAIITLDRDLKIRTYNKMAESIFGYTKEEMLHQSSFEKIIPKQYKILHQEGVSSFLKALKLNSTGGAIEMEAIDKEGHKFPIRISFGTSGENETIAIVSNIQDISKEKHDSKILQQQAKFAALGEMIAIIAHQWRQPLAQLNFNNMYIRKKLSDQELILEISKNEEIIQFMSETITNFEDFYKKTNSAVFNPILSIEQSLKLVDSILCLNQIELIKEIDSKATIYGNSNSLAQVILSIIQNSIDMFKPRNINNPIIHISLKDTKENIVLTIADNAGGVSVTPIYDIFKPFISKKKKTSTGIGLYMSKIIIEDKFKGIINVENINNGAKFIIYLPH